MHRRRRVLLAVTAAVAVATAGAATGAAAKPGHGHGHGHGHGTAGLPPLSHAGRWATDPQGRVVVLHGFNMVAKLPPYDPAAVGFGQDDAAFLAQHGFTTVRLGVIWKRLEPRPGRYDDGYLSSIADTVRLLARHGIYTLLDFHQDMWNERFQGEGAPDWAVADDGLPAQPTAGFPGNYFAMPALWRAFDHFWNNDPTASGVRLQDAYAAAWRHVATYFADVDGVLGYDLLNEPFPGSQWYSCLSPAGCPAVDQQYLAPFVTKLWGATDDAQELDSVAAAADKHMLSWQEWTYVGGDPSAPRPVESIVVDPRRPPTGSNVKWDKLAILERPYPLVVAGTPTSWHYDPSTGAFTLTYSTQGVRGPVRSPYTVVYAPSVHYP